MFTKIVSKNRLHRTTDSSRIHKRLRKGECIFSRCFKKELRHMISKILRITPLNKKSNNYEVMKR